MYRYPDIPSSDRRQMTFGFELCLVVPCGKNAQDLPLSLLSGPKESTTSTIDGLQRKIGRNAEGAALLVVIQPLSSVENVL